MSNPKLENGYTKIADELLDAIIAFPFSKREYKIVLAVLRKTYGFGKKMDDITGTQLAKLTSLDLANVSRTVNDLAKRKVLLKQQGKYGYLLGLSKNYKNWKGLPKRQHLPKRQLPLAKMATTIDNPKREHTHSTREGSRGNFPNAKTGIDPEFKPSEQTLIQLRNSGVVNLEQADTDEFIASQQSSGWMSADWQAAFRQWAIKFRRGRQRSGKQSSGSSTGKPKTATQQFWGDVDDSGLLGDTPFGKTTDEA